MTNELPDFQPSPLGMSEITPETAKRPARKAKEKAPKKERTKRHSLNLDKVPPPGPTDTVITATKKPRKKRKSKQAPTVKISNMALVIELDKIAGRLAELSGCERGVAFKAICKVFK